VAHLVLSRHAQVHALFFQLLFPALIPVHEDCIVLAAIFFGGIWIVVVPAFTALGTVDIKALARSEIRSCFSPHKFSRLSVTIVIIGIIGIITIIVIIIIIGIITIIIFVIVVRDNGVTFTPPYPTDDGAS
jgi:amino acid transporter